MRDGLLDTVSGILHAIMMKLYLCKIILYVTNPRKQQYSGLINDIKDILCLLEWPAADSSPDIIINPIEHVLGFLSCCCCCCCCCQLVCTTPITRSLGQIENKGFRTSSFTLCHQILPTINLTTSLSSAETRKSFTLVLLKG